MRQSGELMSMGGMKFTDLFLLYMSNVCNNMPQKAYKMQDTTFLNQYNVRVYVYPQWVQSVHSMT